MKEIILIKNGELVLKGLNRNNFEDTLIKNIKKSLSGLGKFSVKKAQSTIFIEPLEENFDFDLALNKISKVFGIAAFQRACVCEKDLNNILENSVPYLSNILSNAKTFKVEAKRADKRFPFKSPEICMEVGGHLLKHFPNLKVDVHNPEVTVFVEIRDYNAYIRCV